MWRELGPFCRLICVPSACGPQGFGQMCFVYYLIVTPAMLRIQHFPLQIVSHDPGVTGPDGEAVCCSDGCLIACQRVMSVACLPLPVLSSWLANV